MTVASSQFQETIDGAASSTQRLHAWPSLSQAAGMLGVSLSALSRAMDSQEIVKHRLGRRARKIAPVAVLDLAVQYGADVAQVADELMSIAEHSGAEQRYVAGVEQDIGAWFAGNALQASGPREDELARVLAAMRETLGAEATGAILERAGLSGQAVAASVRGPS
jgi:hypothetical protein